MENLRIWEWNHEFGKYDGKFALKSFENKLSSSRLNKPCVMYVQLSLKKLKEKRNYYYKS